MNEYLMRAYLRSRKGEEAIRKMRDPFIPDSYSRNYRQSNRRFLDDSNDYYDPYIYDIDNVHSVNYESLPNRDNLHFTEEEAEYIVSQMFHLNNGRKVKGEKYDIYKAKEILDRYRGMIPKSITCADIYVAINSQYHDYCKLFKVWFGENIDNKIIESAINFWFKDEDYLDNNKVYKYFSE